MPETPSDLDRLKRNARRFAGSIRPQHIAVVAALTALGLAVAAARTMALPGTQPILAGDRMQIHVVAPLEPEITPGSVVEVGDLVEGFEYRPIPSSAIEPAADAPYGEDSRPRGPGPTPRRDGDHAVISVPPQPEAPVERWRDTRVGRWFGFDAPERDYRAEREARRARIDARIDGDREQREVRWYRSDGESADDSGRDARRRPDGDPETLRR